MRLARRRLLLALALTTSAGCAPDDPLTDVRRTLADDAGGTRPFEAALSVKARHRPCPPGGDTALVVPRTPCDGLRATAGAAVVARRLADALSADPAADALHAQALHDLVWGDTAGNALDASIARLRTAARIAERPAAILADLAAAHLVRAARAQDPRDLLEAMDAAARALEHDSTHWAARFNLALAGELLGLREQAADAWARAAAASPDEVWADEAMERSARARPSAPAATSARDVDDAAAAAALVDSAPLTARLLGWDRALADWGAATGAGDTRRAEGALRVADMLGSALVRAGRDASLQEAVTAIRAHRDDRVATMRLARAHSALAEGGRWYVQVKFGDAARHFRAALDVDAPSEPLRAWCSLFLGASLISGGRFDEGLPLVTAEADRADTVRHVALAARAYWVLGNSLHRARRSDEGTAAIRRAVALYARSGETELLGAVMGIDAEVALALGERAAGYATLARALRTLSQHPWSLRRHNSLAVATEHASRDGMLHAASVLQREDAGVVRVLGIPALLLESALSGSRLQTARGARDADVAGLHGARTLLAQLDDTSSRAWFTAELQLATASAAATPTAAAALASSLDSAIATFEARSHAARLLSALVARTSLALRTGDTSSATLVFDRALSVLDRQHAAIGNEALRASLLEGVREVLDAMLMAHVRAGHVTAALALLERGRASLQRDRGPRVRVPARWHAGEVALDYALVGDTVLAWSIDARGVRLATTVVPRAELQRTVERVRSALELQASDGVVRADLARLHAWLVAPVAMQLGVDGTPLAIVADGELGDVPFAALRDDAGGRYLVESHPLRFAPSLADAHARPGPRVAGTVLLVADPTGDAGARVHPDGLPPLPGAREEVDSLARLLPDATVLAGAQARRDVVRRALRVARLAHYAGHAVFDDERPDRSYLALAAGDGGVDRLMADEIAQFDLTHARLIVLSACQTLRARDGRSGGFASFVGALLGAGSGGVVGSLWQVDDELTRSLMLDFHRAYRDAHVPALALQAAQLKALRSSDRRRQSPAAWAGFRYAGQ